MGDSRTTRGLLERIDAGETVVVAEGYLFEFERRGYLKAGPYVPEIVLEHPELVRAMHREFVHCGSDVVLAFTYYGHREKLRLVGREADLEKMNRTALRIAREVARETGTLLAGNICNSTVYVPDDPSTHDSVTEMFREQIEWAVEEGADFIVAETIGHFGEAMLALNAIKKYGKGLPAVITLCVFFKDETYEGMPITEACKKLEEAGAAVVGLNCARGPFTMLPTIKRIRETVKIPVAALPVCYRTNADMPTMQALRDPESGVRAFPVNLDAWASSREDIARFTAEAQEIGVQYIGLCCGNCAHYIRTMAETLGRSTAASKYSPDMSMHFIFSRKSEFIKHNQELREFLSGESVQHPEDTGSAAI